MMFHPIGELDQHELAQHEPGEEISPGVTIARRRILQFGAAGILGALAVSCRTPAMVRASSGERAAATALTTGELIAAVRPHANALIRSERPDEASYLSRIGALLARYGPEAPWAMSEIAEGDFGMNLAAYVPPVVLYDIEMRPGATIDLHDHRHYNGAIMCVEGTARCRNFDIVAPKGRVLDIAAGEVPPDNEDFTIRQTKDVWIGPGSVSALTRDRDNIHHVEAGPEGCKLVDLFTRFRPEARSYSIDWDGQPLSRGGDLYRVRWRT